MLGIRRDQSGVFNCEVEIMKPHNISVVMITIDRSPKQNYLNQTIENLDRAGVFKSQLLHSFHLFDSCRQLQHFDRWRLGPHSIAHKVWLHLASQKYLACENAGRALKIGGATGAEWVLFCEDDIDVCANFLESVANWLDIHGGDERYRLFAFGAAYLDAMKPRMVDGFNSWDYPFTLFYGTQCFAIRAQDALSLGLYIYDNPEIRGITNPNAYDLMFHDWMSLNYPDCLFLASVPSFVQHIGKNSICTGKEEKDIHMFDTWPGREWSFAGVEVTV